MEYDDSVEVEALDKSLIVGQLEIRAEGSYALLPARRLRIDLGEISGKNRSNRLVRLVQELTKSVTKTSSKMHELKTYDEAINNSINRNRWQKAIDEEL